MHVVHLTKLSGGPGGAIAKVGLVRVGVRAIGFAMADRNRPQVSGIHAVTK